MTPTADGIVQRWASKLGLADAPLFASNDLPSGERHELLLDGGLGSFAISTRSEGTWKDGRAREWAYSSDVPHHVAVDMDKVVVTRWDDASPEAFSISSVEEKLADFYRYLVADKVRSNRKVTDGLVDLFRRTRSAVAQAGADDDATVDAYLSVFSQRLSETGRDVPLWRSELGADAIARLVDQSTFAFSAHELKTDLDLAVRHAGSEIFQEAHFDLVQTSQSDLFGWNAPALSERKSRGTSHFTPPALARIVVEKAIFAVGDIKNFKDLVVMDPACGSASFLYEAVRTLRRIGFDGKLRLVGRDISPSAISMAKFMLTFAKADWEPKGGIELDLMAADSLAIDLPVADIIVMNPPFLSWSAMAKSQREIATDALGPLAGGRIDLSMAFINKSLDRLKEGGALGAVMPASLLSLQAAQKWRKSLMERAHLSMLSSLGEYGLFRHATVQVATLVLTTATQRNNDTVTLIANDERNATGDALRALRRDDVGSHEGWSLFITPAEEFRSGSTWKPVPPHVKKLLERFAGIGALAKIGDLFDIRQGIRTGANEVFLLSAEELSRLSPNERRFFRPAMTGDNLTNGKLRTAEWLFYPHGSSSISSEAELRKTLPRYYENYLLPAKTQLTARSSIVRGATKNWWVLAEHRAWALQAEGLPRVVSKYFGSPGSFALDEIGKFSVVQGFAWFPRWASRPADGEVDHDDFGNALDEELELLTLKAFTTIFNSKVFHGLARYFSSHVGGGQIDLSPRYVASVPVPAVQRLLTDPSLGAVVRHLAELSEIEADTGPASRLWQKEVQNLMVPLYGQEILEVQ